MSYVPFALTCIMQTSGLMILRVKRSGISERKMGMTSERPSATALRTLPAMKNEHERNIPEKRIKISSEFYSIWNSLFLQLDVFVGNASLGFKASNALQNLRIYSQIIFFCLVNSIYFPSTTAAGLVYHGAVYGNWDTVELEGKGDIGKRHIGGKTFVIFSQMI